MRPHRRADGRRNMLAVAVMLCWTRLWTVALQLNSDPAVTDRASSAVTSSVPHDALCLVDDMFTTLTEGVGDDGEPRNLSLALFGLCPPSDSSSGSSLSELSRSHRNGLKVLYPAAVLTSEDEQGALTLTFDLPQSPPLKLNPALVLALESPLTGGDLDLVFSSPSLQPSTQSVCLSAETHYILLTGKSSEGSVHQKWTISADTKSPDMKQNLKDVLIGGKSGSNLSVTPLLLFSGETGTDTRPVPGSPPFSPQTSFLCELKQFLGAVLPQDHSASPLSRLDSLQSLPPLTLGLSSSETLLAGIMNSSAPTVFAFTTWGSMWHRGELALSPALLEELRQRLEETVGQMMAIIREEAVAWRATQRLGRLRELSAFQKRELATGENQYRSFLLLKALQTVSHAYNLQRRLRATRADNTSPVRGSVCGLKTLTVSLEKLLLGPHSANINSCHGSCAFPLTNTNNHAVLLNSHIENGNADERPPCCVPVAYEALEVVDWNQQGTYISIKPDVIAKECGCR